MKSKSSRIKRAIFSTKLLIVIESGHLNHNKQKKKQTQLPCSLAHSNPIFGAQTKITHTYVSFSSRRVSVSFVCISNNWRLWLQYWLLAATVPFEVIAFFFFLVSRYLFVLSYEEGQKLIVCRWYHFLPNLTYRSCHHWTHAVGTRTSSCFFFFVTIVLSKARDRQCGQIWQRSIHL